MENLFKGWEYINVLLTILQEKNSIGLIAPKYIYRGITQRHFTSSSFIKEYLEKYPDEANAIKKRLYKKYLKKNRITMKRIGTLIAVILCISTSLCYAQENLNEIRFKGWTEKEWLDNDYIRELRKYIDACSEGKIKDNTLLAHKEILKSKFIMGHIEPATYGGVFIYFTFLDAPRKVFYTQVYSYVDPDTKRVEGYEVRGVFLDEQELDYTREALLYIVENYPEHKLW